MFSFCCTRKKIVFINNIKLKKLSRGKLRKFYFPVNNKNALHVVCHQFVSLTFCKQGLKVNYFILPKLATFQESQATELARFPS